MSTSQDFVNWVCEPALDWRLLKFVLLAERDTYSRFSHGTTHQTIYFPEVKAFHICLPPIGEQRRIAGVLTALDDKIEHNAALADCLDQLVEIRFRTLLSIARERGWPFAALTAVGEVNQMSHTKRSHPDRIEYIDISGTATRRLEETVWHDFADAPSRARRAVRSGDTLVSTVRPERRSLVFIAESHPGLTASTGFAVVSPKDYSAVLLYRAVTAQEATDHFSASATGSAYPAVNPEVIGAWTVAVPPDRGAEFERTTRPLEELRWHALAENRRLAAIRDALLPKLVSGQVRVPESYDPDDVLGTLAENAAAVA